MSECYVPPPGPGETGARVCETFPEIRARQIAYWNDYLKVTARCPWPTVLQPYNPGPSDDWSEGFKTGQVWHNTLTGETFIAETTYPLGSAIWNPIGGGGGSGIWTRITTSILTAATESVDIVPLANFHGLRYILTAYNEVEEKSKALEILLVREGTGLKESLYTKVSQLNIDVVAAVSGGNLELQISNAESFTVEIDLIKSKFG